MATKRFSSVVATLILLIILSACTEITPPSSTTSPQSENVNSKTETPADWVLVSVYPQVDVKAGRDPDLKIPLPPGHHAGPEPIGRWIVADGQRVQSGLLSLSFGVSTSKAYEMQTPDYNPKNCPLRFIVEVSGKNVVRTYFNPCYGGEVYELVIQNNRFFIEPLEDSTPEEREGIVLALLHAKIENEP